MNVFELSALVFSVLGLGIGIFALIEVKAMQRSTHQVQFINPMTGDVTSKDEMVTQTNRTLSEIYDNI